MSSFSTRSIRWLARLIASRPAARDEVMPGIDVALDGELNVFVRDNENDGGDYMIRVCHSFFAADHGYPYLYYERPDEAMRPLADLGRGSSAGGSSRSISPVVTRSAS